MTSQPVADNWSTAVAELRAVMPEARSERKAMELTIDLYFDLGPTLLKELVPIGDAVID